jgi:hypothetical protein
MTRTPGPLYAALRARAEGLHACKAATELLIGQASWLHRPDFVDSFVHTDTAPTDGILISAINWPEAITALETGRLPCSAGERRMLRIAASLAEGFPIDLRDALTGLDSTNINLVATAVLHANGRK